MTRAILSLGCAILAITLPSGADARDTGAREPYGRHAMTWRTAPDTLAHLAPGARVTLAPFSDLDVWRGGYRLRHRLTRAGACFTLARGRRCLARYSRVSHTLHTRVRVRVFTWRG